VLVKKGWGRATQVHADQLQAASQQAWDAPGQAQAAVRAQSFQAKAQSLEKAAQAQSLQAQAVAHAQAHAQAAAQAQAAAAKARSHAAAHAEAAAHVSHLEKVAQMGARTPATAVRTSQAMSQGCHCYGLPRQCAANSWPLQLLLSRTAGICWSFTSMPGQHRSAGCGRTDVVFCCWCAEEGAAEQVAAQRQHLEAQAQGHAAAQSQLAVHAHNLSAKAHAHANAQARCRGCPLNIHRMCLITTPWICSCAPASGTLHETGAAPDQGRRDRLSLSTFPLLRSAQVQAQAQAQQAAEEACHLDAAAQQLHAEASLVAASNQAAVSLAQGPPAPSDHLPPAPQHSHSAALQPALQPLQQRAASAPPAGAGSLQPADSVPALPQPVQDALLDLPGGLGGPKLGGQPGGEELLNDSQLALAAAEIRVEEASKSAGGGAPAHSHALSSDDRAASLLSDGGHAMAQQEPLQPQQQQQQQQQLPSPHLRTPAQPQGSGGLYRSVSRQSSCAAELAPAAYLGAAQHADVKLEPGAGQLYRQGSSSLLSRGGPGAFPQDAHLAPEEVCTSPQPSCFPGSVLWRAQAAARAGLAQLLGVPGQVDGILGMVSSGVSAATAVLYDAAMLGRVMHADQAPHDSIGQVSLQAPTLHARGKPYLVHGPHGGRQGVLRRCGACAGTCHADGLPG
jgi:hypothetical protein